MRRPLAVTAALVLAVGLAACGDDGDDADTSSSTTTEAPASSTTAAEGATTTTTTAEGSTTTAGEAATTVPDGELPGEPIDIYPYEGAVLAVVGVAGDDTLNVRSRPGTEFDVVAELGPLSEDATATGRNRTLDDDSLWVEVEVGDAVGWVNGAYVAQLGGTTDVTADVPETGGETMLQIAQAVAARRASAEEGPGPTVTVVAGPEVGDVGEITVDVVGLADDALKGERLHIVASPDASGEGFTVTAVEATSLCARGVSGDGLCT